MRLGGGQGKQLCVTLSLSPSHLLSLSVCLCLWQVANNNSQWKYVCICIQARSLEQIFIFDFVAFAAYLFTLSVSYSLSLISLALHFARVEILKCITNKKRKLARNMQPKFEFFWRAYCIQKSNQSRGRLERASHRQASWLAPGPTLGVQFGCPGVGLFGCRNVSSNLIFAPKKAKLQMTPVGVDMPLPLPLPRLFLNKPNAEKGLSHNQVSFGLFVAFIQFAVCVQSLFAELLLKFIVGRVFKVLCRAAAKVQRVISM